MNDWRDDAACKGVDPALFFPEQGGDYQAPKAVCRLCPVAEECLEYAIVHREKYGVWGGLSERQRRQVRWSRKIGPKPRLRPPCGTMSGYRYHIRHLEKSCAGCLLANRQYQATMRAQREAS